MSHKGNKLINIIAGTDITVSANFVTVKGPLGEVKINYPTNLISIEKMEQSLKISRSNDDKQTKMYHGTVNANISNAIIGVNKGFKKVLKIVGVGYKANVANNKLNLSIGYSHPVEFSVPTELKVTCPSPTQIEINGYDKIKVGEFSAKIRAVRPPEPYKGKGIMYINEHIIRKVGKTAETAKTTGSGQASSTKK